MDGWDDRQWVGCGYQLSMSRLVGCRWFYILRFVLSEEVKDAMWTLTVDPKADETWASQLEPVVPHLVRSLSCGMISGVQHIALVGELQGSPHPGGEIGKVENE